MPLLMAWMREFDDPLSKLMDEPRMGGMWMCWRAGSSAERSGQAGAMGSTVTHKQALSRLGQDLGLPRFPAQSWGWGQSGGSNHASAQILVSSSSSSSSQSPLELVSKARVDLGPSEQEAAEFKPLLTGAEQPPNLQPWM